MKLAIYTKFQVNRMNCVESRRGGGGVRLTPPSRLRVTIFSRRLLGLKGYSSGQSHFSEINAKLAEENEFVTHFVQKCLETRENEQNVVLNESSEALGNGSETVRVLVLAMTTADDGVGGSNSV